MQTLALIGMAAQLLVSPTAQTVVTKNFVPPVDAVSVGFSHAAPVVQIRGRERDGTWTAWQTVEANTEQVAVATESDLLMFDAPVTEVQVKTPDAAMQIHEIRVSDAPPSYKVATLYGGNQPHILSRTEWGADASFLYNGQTVDDSVNQGDTENSGTGDTFGESAARVEKCNEDVQNYPQDFKVSKTVRSEDGQVLRWPRQYSPSIKLIAIHHTAIQNTGDTRSGAEKMRALYAYHANNRAWGDIGYHYVIDAQGQIYEGKSGGDYVVGGHAYCNNIGTLGIAMMGNFETEQPSQAQIQSLQWLLSMLTKKYNINPTGSVIYHGKTEQTILGHRDLLDTSCPGFYLYGVIDQMRKHVADSELTAAVTFPVKPVAPAPSSKPFVDQSQARRQQRGGSTVSPSPPTAFKEGISPTGGSTFAGRATAQLLFTLRYQAGVSGAKQGAQVGQIVRSSTDIGLWMQSNSAYGRLRDTITLPEPVPPGGQLLLRLKMQLPATQGSYTLAVGDAVLTLNVTGRALPTGAAPTLQTSSRGAVTANPIVPVVKKSSSSKAAQSSSSSSSSVAHSAVTSSTLIRIRLTTQDSTLQTCSQANMRVLTLEYRGTIACVTVDGAPVLINTLSLEDYMKGVAEEPDTEPYEKQRAFAIAARTYAAYYLDPDNRKFPGKPYDGSDSPATFQKYTGIAAETKNPQWVKAVTATAGTVLTKDGQLIKPPYFSSDDGRTRSPDEVGWGTFPFKEIFSSKPDPWCTGMPLSGHGVGMSGCGAEGQANAGESAEEILHYYYPTTTLIPLSSLSGTR